MIKLTKLNGHELYLSADHIEMMEATPDTIITLINGKKIIVKETLDNVVVAYVKYKKLINKSVSVIDRSKTADNNNNVE